MAIVRLASDVTLSGSVRLACLPRGCLSGSGDDVITAGWGLTSGGGQVSSKLKEATMTTTVK